MRIEERTCELDGAHIEFLCGGGTPLGVKVMDFLFPFHVFQEFSMHCFDLLLRQCVSQKIVIVK